MLSYFILYLFINLISLDESLNLLDQFQFTQPCPTFNLISVKSKSEPKEMLVGLTQYYRLYANKFEIANNCNSYFVHDEFLLFTDHTNTLKFVNLQRLGDFNKENDLVFVVVFFLN